MKKKSILTCIAIFATSFIFISCKKENDNTTFLTYNNYLNPRLGKYIIYNLDSIVTVNFGAKFVTRSYLVKDSFAETFNDNLNRLSYKIFRYQYDSTNKIWNSSNTFFVTPTSLSAEYVVNNIRYIALINPIANDGAQWLGNINASISPFYSDYNFSQWTFSYQNIKQPFKVNNNNFANTVTVLQQDSSAQYQSNAISTNAINTSFHASFDKGYEVYADSIGLIYKDILSWEYQVTPSVYYNGYGVKLRMVSHN